MTDNEKLIGRLRAVIETATSDSMSVENDRVITKSEHDSCQAERDEAEAVRDLIIEALTPTDDERKLARAMARVEQLSDHLGIPYMYETGHGPVRPAIVGPQIVGAEKHLEEHSD